MQSAVKSRQSKERSNESAQDLLNQFKVLYSGLDRFTLSKDELGRVYDDDIEFLDPLHKVQGSDALFLYFAGLYENLTSIDFEFHDELVGIDQAFVTWTMRYKHPLVRRGQYVVVDGNSQLRFQNGRIIFHRDYFDAGAMLYEHIPGVAFVIRRLKERMA